MTFTQPPEVVRTDKEKRLTFSDHGHSRAHQGAKTSNLQAEHLRFRYLRMSLDTLYKCCNNRYADHVRQRQSKTGAGHPLMLGKTDMPFACSATSCHMRRTPAAASYLDLLPR